jgi:hypothetical protein
MFMRDSLTAGDATGTQVSHLSPFHTLAAGASVIVI